MDAQILLYVGGGILLLALLLMAYVYRLSPEAKERRAKEKLALSRKMVKEDARARKEREKAEKALSEVRKEAAPVPAPPKVPIPDAASAKPTNIKSLEEFPIGQTIGWEVTRIVDGDTKRITEVRGVVAIKADRFGRPPKAMFVKVARGGRTNYYFVDPRRLIRVVTMAGRWNKREVVSYKVVFHEFIAEAMKIDGTIEWSDELEMIVADSGLEQYVQIASSNLGFQLTPTIRNLLIIVGLLGLFLGVSVNGAYHIVPTVQIHWVP